ncbi:MAG: hypothetical protein HONBIEJF_00464 [Fimbriimonadaceae bacterium]|nr:hypothetical protein [Fimbriimonadaceae bacterium]
MNKEFMKKLVDLYAGDELPTELKDELETAAFGDPELSHDMSTLKQTVQLLKESDRAEFTEESFQRVLMKIYARGVSIETRSPSPSHLQYHLPIQS